MAISPDLSKYSARATNFLPLIDVKGEAWEITIKPLVSAGCKVAIGVTIAALLSDVGVYILCVAWETGWNAGLVAGTVVSCLLMPVLLLAAMVGVIGSLMRSRVLFDGKTLSMGSMDGFAQIPIEEVRGIRAYTLRRRRLDVDLSRGPWRVFSIVRVPVLEIMLPDGGLAVMSLLDEEKVRWLAEVLADALPGNLKRPGEGVERQRIARCSTVGRKGRLVYVALALGTGAVCLGGSLWTIGRAFQSWRWPTVQGQVVHSHYEETRPSGNDVSYQVEFKYRYEVGGRAYSSEAIGFMRGNDEAVVKRLVTEHPEHSAVLVYYDPARPAEAVVLPGPGPLLWFFLPLGWLMVLWAVPLMFGVPTREEAAFARRYASHPAAVKGGLAETETIRWTTPADLFEEDLKKLRRASLMMAVRTTVICGLVWWGMRTWLRPIVPDFPWNNPVLWAVLAAPGGTFFFAWLEMMVRPGKRAEYALLGSGIRIPRREVPLVKWARMASFQVERRGPFLEHRVLMLHLRDGMALRLTLPTDDVAEEIITRAREHLAEEEPEARYSGLQVADWVIGVAVGAIWTMVVWWVASHYPAWIRHDQVSWIMLLTLAPGPGGLCALTMRDRRAVAQLFKLGCVVNLVTFLPTVIILVVRVGIAHR